MAYNSQDLKVVSIFQLVMTAVFLILGLVDRLQVRYFYTSFLMSSCWTAAIVLPVGIVGLVLSRMSRRPPNLIYALKSVSVACAVMSAATMYHYQWGISSLVYRKARFMITSRFVEKDTEFKFTRQENTMLAISSLAILFPVIEMILAFASAKSCGDTGYEPPQDNQVVYPFRQLGTGQIQLQPPQPTYFAAQPMVAGQAVIAGQQMVAAQPMVLCQPLIAGQAVVAGQQMVAGQPMVYDQKMASAQSSV
ncbi:uncharacterized protein [Montipora capricornis]|uniref:uncharacterized protein n=1 Tax=Montipora capricornis TaxID=246305 RepID=UPI0035F1CD14